MFVKKRCRWALKSKNRIGQRSIPRYKRRSCGPPSETDESVKTENGGDILKQTSYGKLFQVSMQLLEEYCTNSTLHGVRYFVAKKSHWLERFWWVTGFVVSIFCCGALIQKVYDNWDQRSIIVSISEELTPVSDIPLPAITICPSTKIKSNDFNLTDLFKRLDYPEVLFNLTDKEAETVLAFFKICHPYHHIPNTTDKFSEDSIIDFVWKLAPSVYETIPQCWLQGYIGGSYLLCQLGEIMTELGLCFTFNMLNEKETYSIESTAYSEKDRFKKAQWNLDSGYDPNIELNFKTYPHQASGSVDTKDLKIIMIQRNEHYHDSCAQASFHIAMHLPGEIPQKFQFKLLVASLESVEVTVKPKVITTSDGLRSYHPNKRKCYFNADRKLRFLKLYTQGNCELECLSNFTLSVCGCVPHFLLREANTPLCRPERYICFIEARSQLVNGQIKRGLYITKENKTRLNKLVENCNCLPSCNSIKYDAEIRKYTTDRDSDDYRVRFINASYSTLSIEFEESKFMTLKRSEVYGTIDFIANCGGLLGLFIGASFLSVVEVLYYCSLRIYCTRLNRKRENKIAIPFISN